MSDIDTSAPKNFIRPSALIDIDRCPMYYYLRWEATTVVRDSNFHTTFGTLLHNAIMQFYMLRQSIDFYDAVSTVMMQLMKDSHGYEGPPPKDRYSLLRTFLYFTEKYKDELFQVLHLDGVPALEQRRNVTTEYSCTNGDPWVISMQMDRVVTLGDMVFIYDTKTSSRMWNDASFQEYERSHQVFAYMFGAQLLPTPPMWLYIEGVQILANDSRFTRRPIAISPDRLNYWATALLPMLLQTIDSCREAATWPQRFASCVTRYGVCPFWHRCAGVGEIQDETNV